MQAVADTHCDSVSRSMTESLAHPMPRVKVPGTEGKAVDLMPALLEHPPKEHDPGKIWRTIPN